MQRTRMVKSAEDQNGPPHPLLTYRTKERERGSIAEVSLVEDCKAGRVPHGGHHHTGGHDRV